MKRIITGLLMCVCAYAAAAPTTDIKVDQAGYLPSAPKVAFVVSATPATEFTVRSGSDNTAAFQGKLSAPAADADSGDNVQVADFTKLTKAGKYYIEVSGVGRSWEFSIATDVYTRAYYLAMRAFYAQRCGTAVDLGPEFPGYKHEACHLEGAYHASAGKTGPHVSLKGWHDAGDYGRYIVNSGITTGTLLWTYELFADRIGKVNLNIPESENKTPDILDEIRWNLEWMLSMQDPDDGGVWHKQTTAQFPGFIMPEKDKGMNLVIGTGSDPFKNSGAGGDFAAVMAIAGRLYKPFDAKFAADCLAAAKRAYAWLEKFPNVRFSNPQGVGTGGYGDGNLADERLWAAAELYRTTGDEAYHKYFLENYGALRKSIRPIGPQTWGDVSTMGLWTYALGKGKNAEAVEEIRNDSIAAADEIVKRAAQNGYRITMTPRDYVWGSNGVAGNYGLQLLVANIFQPNPAYVNTALDNLHYLLGRNAFSLSYVTQVGSNAFMNPHHRPSGADGLKAPWPGMLSGGPNRSPGDPAMRAKLKTGIPPARMYLDDEEAYAANEIAINWQAPLVFLLAGVQPAK
jgi:endoglucanase